MKDRSFVHAQSNDQTALFQAIQFSVCYFYVLSLKSTVYKSNSSIWSIDRTLSGATTPNQSGPGSDGKEKVLRIPKAPAPLEPHHQIV